VPLDVVKDPTKNIIIIDCTAPKYIYTVMYYLDGVFKEKVTLEAQTGTVITQPPRKTYPGYHLDHITGTPLTVVDNTGVIRVYYKKDIGNAAASVSAALYKDSSYKQKVTKSKSGYGVYGQFTVDVSTYVEDETLFTISSVTATWKEGLPINIKTNKLGKEVKDVTLVFDKKHSNTDKGIYVYNFPKNKNSAQEYQKAYIPIGWADNSDWTVTFKAKITLYDADGNPYEGPTKTGKASIRVNGSMYEDDFTGGRN